MFNSRFFWCLVVAVLAAAVVQAQDSELVEKSHEKAHVRVARQGGGLLGPIIVMGLAGAVGGFFGSSIANKKFHGGHGHQPFHYGGYPPYRRRRSTEQPAEFPAEFEIDEAMVLRVAAMDESGCGARLLCELHQEEPGQLNGTIARRLVQIFDGQQPPNFELLKTEPKAAFQYAAFVGVNSQKNLKTCANVFNHCPFNAKIILEVLNSKSSGFLSGDMGGL